MAIEMTQGASWTRKHDDPRISYLPTTTRVRYPRTLADQIQICSDGSLVLPANMACAAMS